MAGSAEALAPSSRRRLRQVEKLLAESPLSRQNAYALNSLLENSARVLIQKGRDGCFLGTCELGRVWEGEMLRLAIIEISIF